MTETFQEKDVLAQHQEAIDFLKGLFETDDTLCITFVHSTDVNDYGQAVTQNKFGKMSYYITERGLAALQKRNDDGWHVFVSMQPFLGGSRERLLPNVSQVRHAFVDLDKNGPESLAQLRRAVKDGLVPQPAFIVESSPNKYHVEWNVEDISLNEARALNESLLKMFNGDEHCKDVARVLRIPSFVNCKPKYGPNFPVARIIERGTDDIYSLSDFHIPVEVVDYNIEGLEEGTPIEFNEAVFHAAVEKELEGPSIPYGSHDGTLFNIASRLRHYAGDEEHIYEALVEICEARCVNYGSDYKEMCRAKAHNVVERYDVGTLVGKPTLFYDANKHINVRVLLAYDEASAEGNPIQVAEASIEVASSPSSEGREGSSTNVGATLSVEEPLPDFTSMLTGSLADFCRATEPDFPMEFKFMSAITRMGLALSGRVYTVNGSALLQPRFYTCLIAEPWWGKSGSMGVIQFDFSRRYDEIVSLDSAPALVTSFRERYIHEHGGDKGNVGNADDVDTLLSSVRCPIIRVLLWSDETKDVMEKAKASKESKGNIGTSLLMCFEGNLLGNNTKGEGNLQIKNAHLSWLGGATPSGYDAMWMNTAGAMGGLQSRVTPVGTNNPKCPQKRRPSNTDAADAALLRIHEQVRTAEGEIIIDSEAEALLESWWAGVESHEGSTRVPDIIRRYLTVLAVSNDTTTVGPSLMECGIAFGNHILAMRSKHNPSDATSPVQAFENRIIKAYRKWGLMTEREAGRKIHPENFAGGYSAFNTAMYSLQSAGVLERVDTTGVSRKRRWGLTE